MLKILFPHHFSILGIALLSLILTSCGIERVMKMCSEAREDNPGMFVQNKNMEIIPVSDFRSHNYSPDTLVAIQNDRQFMRVDGEDRYLRLIKGPMNMYYLYTSYITSSFGTPTSYNVGGTKLVNRVKITRYFDLGLDQPLIDFNRENLGKHMSDCSSCLDVLHRYDRHRKGLRWWKYANWASIGGGVALAVSGDPDATMSDLELYSFTGLFFGGLFSEVYRWTQINKIETRIEDAVREYNQFKY